VPGGQDSTDLMVDRVARAADLTPEEYRRELRSLTFRRGFLLTPAADDARVAASAGVPDWRVRHLGDHVLRLHPEARCVVVRTADTHVALIGDAFDPLDPAASPQVLAERFARTLAQTDEFHDLLDRVGGRFRLVVARGHSATVWHDAMGAASVFYAESGRVCASHSTLVARVTGAEPRDFVMPFVASQGYRRRDVKYLPGALAPYDGVVQLTPNTRLDVERGSVTRYWPREPLVRTTPQAAAAVLEEYLRGMGAWMRAQDRVPLVGLTGGTDSRGVLVACADLRPRLFTYVRSGSGMLAASPDSRAAATLAATLGLPLQVLQVRDRPALNEVTAPVDAAFRLATGHVRGSSATWVGAVHRELPVEPRHLYVRGFGGEVLRGFYQDRPTAATRPTPNQLARAYDVNAGSVVTRAAFEHFTETTGFADACAAGALDPNDLLYWEHRMGVWGSVAMSEADLAMPGIVGYNSRALFSAFLGLDYPTRASRSVVHTTLARMRPELMTDLATPPTRSSRPPLPVA
jgi:hypothetical protein